MSVRGGVRFICTVTPTPLQLAECWHNEDTEGFKAATNYIHVITPDVGFVIFFYF